MIQNPYSTLFLIYMYNFRFLKRGVGGNNFESRSATVTASREAAARRLRRVRPSLRVSSPWPLLRQWTAPSRRRGVRASPASPMCMSLGQKASPL